MLLLSLLLQEHAAVERSRLLIDALLKVSRRSAASICRQAGVQPGNLTRFRQVGGATQISYALQECLLKALEWPAGAPAPLTVHAWRIFDLEGCAALDWLLQQDELKDAQFIRLEGKVRAGRNGKHMLVGKLTASGACCHILVDDISLVQNPRLTGIPIVQVSKDLVKAVTVGMVSGQDLLPLFSNGIATFPVQSRLMPDLVEAIDLLGITREEHNQLLLSWLVKLSRNHPERALKLLQRLEKLSLNGDLIAPKAMTAKELDQLLRKLSEFPT